MEVNMQHKINIQPVDDTLEPVQSPPDRSDLSELYVRSAEVTEEELNIAQAEVARAQRSDTKKALLVPLITVVCVVVGVLTILYLSL